MEKSRKDPKEKRIFLYYLDKWRETIDCSLYNDHRGPRYLDHFVGMLNISYASGFRDLKPENYEVYIDNNDKINVVLFDTMLPNEENNLLGYLNFNFDKEKKFKNDFLNKLYTGKETLIEEIDKLKTRDPEAIKQIDIALTYWQQRLIDFGIIKERSDFPNSVSLCQKLSRENEEAIRALYLKINDIKKKISLVVDDEIRSEDLNDELTINENLLNIFPESLRQKIKNESIELEKSNNSMILRSERLINSQMATESIGNRENYFKEVEEVEKDSDLSSKINQEPLELEKSNNSMILGSEPLINSQMAIELNSPLISNREFPGKNPTLHNNYFKNEELKSEKLTPEGLKKRIETQKEKRLQADKEDLKFYELIEFGDSEKRKEMKSIIKELENRTKTPEEKFQKLKQNLEKIKKEMIPPKEQEKVAKREGSNVEEFQKKFYGLTERVRALIGRT